MKIVRNFGESNFSELRWATTKNFSLSCSQWELVVKTTISCDIEEDNSNGRVTNRLH